ncbi:MAG: oligosaccharide flippase family protein [Lachnospiraceae bacterium]|nr:oligosaccharide flippase family protein [Lachnospiraceae bacterium]
MRIRLFLTESKNREADGYIWNMLGSLLMAFQSVIMLMIFTRVLNLRDAGIFTIAYANANLFLTIGKYGMRNFQVSDVKEQFNFSEYRRSRYVTTTMMLVVSLIYVLYIGKQNSYTLDKSLVIILMCVFKAVDSVEDVYHGLYQQKGRLDVAAKALTLRMLMTIAVFGISVIILRNLLLSVIIVTVITIIIFIIFTVWTSFLWKGETVTISKDNIGLLLKLCFPLFVGTFLAFYIGNAPKYAIDAVLSDELQACYGFIAMPVFVIELLNNFIFTPIVHKMSVLWNEQKLEKLMKRVYGQIIIIGSITLICMIGAYLVGIPVLSWLYNTDLSLYKTELMILLLGGGFLALCGFLCTMLTIIRFQKSIIWGYSITAVAAFWLFNWVVRMYGMLGAAMLFMLLMGCLSTGLGAVFWWRVKQGKQTIDNTVC